ncbi:MAG: cell division protein ZapA [Oscillospiraceae bacterium]|nr:cell division protein ZapA [Oscillospiraceae bacterium]
MNSFVSVKVTIAGRDYDLRTDDTSEYLLETAADLDGRITSLLKENPSFGIQNAAVIAALTALDDARKANEAIDNIRGQIKAYVADAAKTRAAKDKLNERIQALEATVELLDRVNKQLEKENKELKKTRSPFEGEQLTMNAGDAPETASEPSDEPSDKETAVPDAVGDEIPDEVTATDTAVSSGEDEAGAEAADEKTVEDVGIDVKDDGIPRRKRKRKR